MVKDEHGTGKNASPGKSLMVVVAILVKTHMLW